MGPLDVSDVKANGCKLKWKKPEDDGGVPVDHYEVSWWSSTSVEYLGGGRRWPGSGQPFYDMPVSNSDIELALQSKLPLLSTVADRL